MNLVVAEALADWLTGLVRSYPAVVVRFRKGCLTSKSIWVLRSSAKLLRQREEE